MTFTEEFESIREAIYHKPWEDTGRLEACLSYALEALGGLAAGECNCYPGGFSPDTYEGPQRDCPNPEHGEASHIAQEALRRMEMRVRLGDDVRPDADMAMAWDYPVPRWRETLDDEDLT